VEAIKMIFYITCIAIGVVNSMISCPHPVMTQDQ